MNEIKKKLFELNELLQVIPTDCKGADNSDNRHKYLRVKLLISKAIEEI